MMPAHASARVPRAQGSPRARLRYPHLQGYEAGAEGKDIRVLDQVRALIERLSPEPMRDNCITERLDLSAGQLRWPKR